MKLEFTASSRAKILRENTYLLAVTFCLGFEISMSPLFQSLTIMLLPIGGILYNNILCHG